MTITIHDDTFECEHCGEQVSDMSVCTHPYCQRYDLRSIEGDDQDFQLDNYEDIMEEVDDYDEDED